MLRALVALGLLASGFCSAQDASKKVELFMPDLQVPQEDAYMCLPLKLSEDKSAFITGFEPKADMSISHHILLYGCEEPGDESGKPFRCTQMDQATETEKPTCAKGSAIIYAWAMGAPAFQLPRDVAFKVGKGTKLKSLVLQMHFKFNGTFKGGSGLTMTMQDKPTPKVAGVYLMATGGVLPSQSTTYLEAACEYSLPTDIEPFAYRAHTHGFGVVVSGYRVRDNRWTEIGRKNPQLPQMFYPITTPGMDIEFGDVLAARCTMKNNGEKDIMIGATKNDEMCNFYIMYAVPNNEEAQELMKEAYGCFSEGMPYTRGQWQREFGIRSGFPRESIEVPAGDVELAKTMGDHMNMNMNMNHVAMSMPSDDTQEQQQDDNELSNDEMYRELLEDSDDSDDSDNELDTLRKRYYGRLFSDSADESY